MPRRLKITILSDDRAVRGLKARHGFSVLVEAAGRQMLFDTGQGRETLENAQRLGIDLSGVEAIVLSHGHYDHSGGLPNILSLATRARVYCHPRVFAERYSQGKGRPARPVGMPPKVQKALSTLGKNRLILASRPVQVLPGAWTTGRVARKASFEKAQKNFTLDREGKVLDPIVDDQGLWTNIPQGLVVITGCAHSGIINTVRQAKALSGKNRLAAVIGGFHLGAASPERLERTAAALNALNPGLVLACHCTGTAAGRFLEKELGGTFGWGFAGLALNL